MLRDTPGTDGTPVHTFIILFKSQANLLLKDCATASAWLARLDPPLLSHAVGDLRSLLTDWTQLRILQVSL